MKRNLLSLGAASAVEMAVQFTLPMLLVRLLSPEAFGAYRSLWLVVSTGVAVLPWAIPLSLYYFLPRAGKGQRSPYLLQSTAFMALAGLLSLGILLLHRSADAQPLYALPGSAAFVVLWVFACLLDTLCNALGRNQLQAAFVLGFALARLGLTLTAAWMNQSPHVMVGVHVALACIKALVCVGVVWHFARRDGLTLPNRQTLADQTGYALPFGSSAALYGVRSRLDQWIVVSLFSSASYGAYSVAGFVLPVQGLVRNVVNGVLLPRINQLHAERNEAHMMATNQRANLGMALLMFPVLAFVFVHAKLLLSTLFTHQYAGADQVVRLYAAVLLLEVIEVSSLLMAWRQGGFMFRMDVLMLIVTGAAGLTGAHLMGPTGAAIGGVAGAALSQTANYRRLASLTAQPVAQLQQWAKLARLILAAALASGASWLVVGALPNVGLSPDHRWLTLGAAALCHGLLLLPLVCMGPGRPALAHALGSDLARRFRLA